jgi:hypothetical protein
MDLEEAPRFTALLPASDERKRVAFRAKRSDRTRSEGFQPGFAGVDSRSRSVNGYLR